MLQSIKKTKLMGKKKAGEKTVSATASSNSRITVKEFEELTWKENSKDMFNTVVEEIPFFIRPIAAPKFRKAITLKAASDGVVTEKMVIACAKEETLPKYVGQVLQKIEPLKTK